MGGAGLSTKLDHMPVAKAAAAAASAKAHSASVAVCGSASLARRCHASAAASSSAVGEVGAAGAEPMRALLPMAMLAAQQSGPLSPSQY